MLKNTEMYWRLPFFFCRGLLSKHLSTISTTKMEIWLDQLLCCVLCELPITCCNGRKKESKILSSACTLTFSSWKLQFWQRFFYQTPSNLLSDQEELSMPKDEGRVLVLALDKDLIYGHALFSPSIISLSAPVRLIFKHDNIVIQMLQAWLP